MGVSRNTVRSALAADGPPKYQRAKSGSIVYVAEPRIRELLHEFPTMPTTVIAELIDWDRSIRACQGGHCSFVLLQLNGFHTLPMPTMQDDWKRN